MRWTLIPLSIIYGLIAVQLLRRFTDPSQMHSCAKRMLAHVMELRMWIDSPRLIFRAQIDLLRENLILLRLTSLPIAVTAAIFILLFPQLDATYGHCALKPGQPSVVTARLEDAEISPPAGIRVDSAAVRSMRDRDVSWQITPLGSTSGTLRITHAGRTLTRSIVAGDGIVTGWRLPFVRPEIDIPYPKTQILGFNWMLWFFLISSVTALVYAR